MARWYFGFAADIEKDAGKVGIEIEEELLKIVRKHKLENYFYWADQKPFSLKVFVRKKK